VYVLPLAPVQYAVICIDPTVSKKSTMALKAIYKRKPAQLTDMDRNVYTDKTSSFAACVEPMNT
jgi:hypothetical protein